MLFLLDTSAVSDLMWEAPAVEARIRSLRSEDRAIVCSIVRGEIQFGLRRLQRGSRRRDALEAKAAKVFARIPCEPVPSAAGDRYADVKLARQRAGLGLDENDLWIAATCLAMGATLVTRDTDFQGIEGLLVEDWSARETQG